MKTKICEASGSRDDIAYACVDRIEPGYVYEVNYLLTRSVSGNEERLYDVFKSLETAYPGIGVNYVGVSADGKTVTFQIFDPPGVSGVVIAFIIIAIATAIIAVFTYLGIEKVTTFFGGALPPPPREGPVSTAFWAALTVAVAGVGTYLIIRAFRK